MKRNAKNLRKYKKVCWEIWQERPHVCEDCGKPIHTARYHNFSHQKGRIGKNALDKNSIKIKCFECHSNNDHGLNVKNSGWMDAQ